MAPPKDALRFVNFVNASPTPFHAVAKAAEALQQAGFKQVHERDSWTSSVRPGGRYYVTRNGSSIAAFAVGREWRAGNPISIVGAHTDSCCLRLKPVSKKSNVGYDQIGVETYGGGIWTSWFDRDLSLAGRVLVREGGDGKNKNNNSNNSNIVQKLVKVDRPLLRIPTLAIHLNRQSSFDPNLETELCPIAALAEAQLNKSSTDEPAEDKTGGGGGGKGPDFQPLAPMSSRHHPAVLDIVAEEAGVSVDAIVDFELVLYDTQDACVGGLGDEFIFSPRLDNLEMTYCAVEGLIASVKAGDDALAGDPTIRMAVCFDHEEIGSKSAQGAHSNMLPAVLRRLAVLPGAAAAAAASAASDKQVADETDTTTAFEQTLARSFLISADMAHAVHPNYAAKHEAAHQPAMNKGPVIKVNANQRYATNSPGVVLVQECAREAGVPLQLFVVRNDSPCGSTIGPGLAALLGVRTLDLGNAQLSMHSIRETGGSRDVGLAVGLFDKFFATYGKLEARMKVD